MKGILVSAVISVLIVVSAAAAVENKGPERITLDGGSRGVVPFPHRLHQSKLNDCGTCHSLFPQKPHAIEELIKAHKLAPKQVMNKLCIKCHKAERRAGHKAGPVTCSKCHQKG